MPRRDTSGYVVNGVRLPSVTEVLSIAGLTDFSGVPPGVLEKARVRGTQVHEITEWIDDGLTIGEVFGLDEDDADA